MADGVSIMKMTLSDLDDIMKIEQETFTSQWTRSVFYKEIQHNPYAHYYTLRYRGKIVGFAGLWLIKESAQVTNIAITPEYQGKKLGKQLFSFIFHRAIKAGCESLSLEVRKSKIGRASCREREKI